MNTRKISKDDIRHLAKLFDNYRIFYGKESDIKGSEKFLSERFENKESEIFVVESEEYDLIGFVQLYPIFSSTQMKRLWLLNDLFIENIHRGKGISVLLIEEAKKLCIETKASGLVLETAKSNEIGNKLYPKMGFSLDIVHNYYSWDNN